LEGNWDCESIKSLFVEGRKTMGNMTNKNERKSTNVTGTKDKILKIMGISMATIMLSACTANKGEDFKEVSPIAAQAETEAPTTVAEVEPTEGTITKSPEDYIKSVMESSGKVNDNKEPKWMAFIWNDITGTAYLKSDGDKAQLQKGEKLIIYVPGGIESASWSTEEIIERDVYKPGECRYLEFTFVEFSGEEKFSIVITPRNKELARFEFTLVMSYNFENVIETQPSVDKEFSENMSYDDWFNSEDMKDGLIFLWEGDTNEGRGKIITNGERIYKGENQKIIFSTIYGMYTFDILTPETVSGKPFKGTDFEMAVIDSDKEFDVNLLVEDRLQGTETEFTFTIVP